MTAYVCVWCRTALETGDPLGHSGCSGGRDRYVYGMRISRACTCPEIDPATGRHRPGVVPAPRWRHRPAG